jgi:two-component sensor histidine kinase
MTSSRFSTFARPRRSGQTDDLLLRETNHRCSNDLQLVVSLLALQSRPAESPEVRKALADVMERVSILAHARSTMHHDRPPTLEAALQRACDALRAQAEPRGILITLQATDGPFALSDTQIVTLTLVVNELATNVIKHAFAEDTPGQISVSISRRDGYDAIVTVDDDGLPFPDASNGGLGLGLATRLMASIGGLFIRPAPGSKMFELRVPAT